MFVAVECIAMQIFCGKSHFIIKRIKAIINIVCIIDIIVLLILLIIYFKVIFHSEKVATSNLGTSKNQYI